MKHFVLLFILAAVAHQTTSSHLTPTYLFKNHNVHTEVTSLKTVKLTLRSEKQFTGVIISEVNENAIVSFDNDNKSLSDIDVKPVVFSIQPKDADKDFTYVMVIQHNTKEVKPFIVIGVSQVQNKPTTIEVSSFNGDCTLSKDAPEHYIITC